MHQMADVSEFDNEYRPDLQLYHEIDKDGQVHWSGKGLTDSKKTEISDKPEKKLNRPVSHQSFSEL